MDRPPNAPCAPISAARKNSSCAARRWLWEAANRSSGRLSQSLQLARQRVSPLRDVARAEAHDHVARLGDAVDHRGKPLGVFQRTDIAMSARANAHHQMIAVDVLDRLLARRIDLG